MERLARTTRIRRVDAINIYEKKQRDIPYLGKSLVCRRILTMRRNLRNKNFLQHIAQHENRLAKQLRKSYYKIQSCFKTLQYFRICILMSVDLARCIFNEETSYKVCRLSLWRWYSCCSFVSLRFTSNFLSFLSLLYSSFLSSFFSARFFCHRNVTIILGKHSFAISSLKNYHITAFITALTVSEKVHLWNLEIVTCIARSLYRRTLYSRYKNQTELQR